jgi:hypothetical protein
MPETPPREVFRLKSRTTVGAGHRKQELPPPIARKIGDDWPAHLRPVCALAAAGDPREVRLSGYKRRMESDQFFAVPLGDDCRFLRAMRPGDGYRSGTADSSFRGKQRWLRVCDLQGGGLTGHIISANKQAV